MKTRENIYKNICRGLKRELSGILLNEAKVIKRNLPIQKYKIINSFATDDYCTCDNCNKVIKNIAVVQGQNGNSYNVGTDCAATLSGIDEYDIYYLNSQFEQVKRFYAKVRKFEKTYGALKVIKNTYYSNDLEAIFEKPDSFGREVSFTVEMSPDVFMRFCPKYRDITYANFNFKKLDADKEASNIEDGMKIAPNAFIKLELRYGKYDKYAYAAIVDKKGNVVVEGSNGGHTIESCKKEAVRCLNKYKFEQGLRKLTFDENEKEN